MSSPSSSRLVGIRAKIERAEEHINDLDSRIVAFLKSEAYSVSVEDDPKTDERAYRVHFHSPIPLALSLVAGDALHNLRSALDHLVWQLVEAAGNMPTRETAYPIFKDASAAHKFFQKSKAKPDPKIKGVPGAAVQLIEATNPYQGGNNQLWAVHELNNIDKHRLLITVATESRHMAIARDGKRQSVWERPDILLLQEGTELFRWPRSLEDEDNCHLQFTFQISFGEPEVFKGQPVVPFLHQLAHLVDGIVSQFVPFL